MWADNTFGEVWLGLCRRLKQSAGKGQKRWGLLKVGADGGRVRWRGRGETVGHEGGENAQARENRRG